MSKEITSSSNPYVKQLRALVSSKKARQESGTFVIEGDRGIKSVLDHPGNQYTLEQLIVSNSWSGTLNWPESIETIRMPAHVFDKVSDVKNAQGILGIVRHTPLPFKFNEDSGNYLLLDTLRDPGNLGTLIRSSVGADFDGILLYGDCVEAFNPKVIRSTMGTFAVARIRTIGDKEVTELLKQGYDLCVTSGAEGENLYKTQFGKKNVLVIGSEAHGVSEVLMQQATRKVTIPLTKECESLNAAIAGSICMFQMRNA